MNSKLSIVILFLNEGSEVRKTVQSIIDSITCRDDIEIILLDDASDDNYNYKQIAADYNARYIKNKIRKGTGLSRNLGVIYSTSNNVLMLDAHMRCFDIDWHTQVIQDITCNPREILCYKTLAIDTNSVILDDTHGYGAYINIETLRINWNSKDLYENQRSYRVPSILGAAYAVSREYWLELGGLSGLVSYGCDEQLISIKSWVLGSGCRFVRTPIFGHTYREIKNVPYNISEKYFTFNLFFCKYLLYFKVLNNESYITRLKEQMSEEDFMYLEAVVNKNIFNISKSMIERQAINIRYFIELNNSINILNNKHTEAEKCM